MSRNTSQLLIFNEHELEGLRKAFPDEDPPLKEDLTG